MAASKVVCACIMIFLVISSQADARRLMAATCDGKEGACKGGVAVKAMGAAHRSRKWSPRRARSNPAKGCQWRRRTPGRRLPGTAPASATEGRSTTSVPCSYLSMLLSKGPIELGTSTVLACNLVLASAAILFISLFILFFVALCTMFSSLCIVNFCTAIL